MYLIVGHCCMQLVTFEGFRDLVKLLRLSISEETGIALAEDENLEMRASAKSTAIGQFNQQTAPPGPRSSTGIPAGKPGHPQMESCLRCVPLLSDCMQPASFWLPGRQHTCV